MFQAHWVTRYFRITIFDGVKLIATLLVVLRMLTTVVDVYVQTCISHTNKFTLRGLYMYNSMLSIYHVHIQGHMKATSTAFIHKGEDKNW